MSLAELEAAFKFIIKDVRESKYTEPEIRALYKFAKRFYLATKSKLIQARKEKL
jgi:hypothetical protein